jgi:hypothetical protein
MIRWIGCHYISVDYDFGIDNPNDVGNRLYVCCARILREQAQAIASTVKQAGNMVERVTLWSDVGGLHCKLHI